MSKSAIIVLVRHGSTYLNGQEGTLRGWSDVSLDDKGHREAEESAEEVKEQWPDAQKLYTSNLARAKESAEYLERALDLKALETKALRPWNPGNLQGRPQVNLDSIMEHYSTHLDEAPEGGESMRTFLNRYLDFLTELIDDAEKGQSPIVAVCSIRNIEAAIGWLDAGMVSNKIDPSALIAKEETVKPGGIVELKRNGRKDWAYEIVLEKPDVNDNEESEAVEESNSHRPPNVFGYYK